MKSIKKQVSVAVLSVPILLSSLGGSNVSAASTLASVTLPSEPSWGYFVDNYKNNKSDNNTLDSNPAIGLLSGYNKLWTAGTSWDTGAKLNSSVLNLNIQKVINTAARRTTSEADAAYLDDRRNQSYSMITGLGSLADVYKTEAKATTTILNVATDATTKKYSDEGNNAGDPTSNLGNVVSLVNTLRGEYSSTNPSKAYFNYPRPFRWIDSSLVVPALIPVQNADPSKDGGFPSGHTNAAYLSAFAMAYAVPERFQELLTRASELGDSRIVAGMHSPLDVMGGRVMATALAAAILSDPDNAELKQAAYQDAHNKLLTKKGTATDQFSDYAKNKQEYTERLTYGFSQMDSKTSPMVVPKGAEVLMETRLPYLDSTQRRWVLATTGLPSGYPVLDDVEGWGRLDLYAAAAGYGAFTENVTVTMDSKKGGFNAMDSWRNNIYGGGKLTKKGSGTLKLEGNNTYFGGTQIVQGTLEGGSKTAFGTANVTNDGGILRENVVGQLVIGGNYKQSNQGTLELNIGSKNDVLKVNRMATLGGKLQLNFTDNYVPFDGETIITFDKRNGSFSTVETVGLPSNYKIKVIYKNDSIQLKVTK